MSAFVRTLALVALAAVATPQAVAAQGEQSRITGKVTDGSGGALPGVTVTIASARLAKPITIFTDGVGQYSSPPLQSATYNVKFELSGFETRTNPAIYLQPGDTIVLDRQMALASLAETVEVVAPAPPPPARVKIELPKRPQPQPVPKALLASVCGPGQAGPSLAIGHVLGHRDEPARALLGNGDALAINIGTSIGVAVGQNYVVRRRFRTSDRNAAAKQATFGEQTAGLVQVVETGPTASTAVVVYLCGELYAGDSIEAFDAMPLVATQPGGAANFEAPAKIVFGEHGQTMGSPGRLMVIDKGLSWGARRGQLLTIFRRSAGAGGPITTIGAAIVVVVNADSATIRIEKVTDAVTVGDMVALHR